MISLNDREKYCLALIITKGGQADYEEIKDTILETRESFADLSDRYLKYTAIRRTLRSLVSKGYLSERTDGFKINPVIEVGFVQQFPIVISKAIRSTLKYRKEHMLEFNTSEVEDYLLDEEYYNYMENPPYTLIEELKDSLKLQRIGSYDSVLVKCGKCVEIMLNELNRDYSLFDRKLSAGNMINQLRNENVVNKIGNEVDRDDLRTFTDGINVVYRFRNIMGAHSGWAWGQDQVATSCLILTFYLADLYISNIKK